MATREIRLPSIKGLSSYELAVKSGTFTGTLIEYLNKEQQCYNDMVIYGDALKDELGGIDTETLNELMADAVRYEEFATYADMEAWLSDEANAGTLKSGDLLLIDDMDVPNYWIIDTLEVADENTGYYYQIAELGDLFGEGSPEIDTSKLVSLDAVPDNRVITNAVDLNDYLEVGHHAISIDIVDQILNKPEGASAGDLFVKCTIDDNVNTGEMHRQQVYMTYDNTGIYTRYIHRDSVDGDIVYDTWKKIVTEDDLASINISLENAVLTGTPEAPTADAGSNTKQIANTAFVQMAISNLVDSAPETMNTLKELATAIEEHQDITDALDSAIGNKADKTELSNYALSGHIVSTKLNGSSFASLEEFVEATATDVTSHNMFRFKDTVGWGPCGIANLWYRCIAMYQNKYSDEDASKVGGTLLLWHGNTAVPHIGFIDGNKAGDNFDGVSVTWNTLAITTDIETNPANQGRYKGDLNEIPFIESGKTFIYDCRSGDCTNLPTRDHATVKVTYFDSVNYCTQECITLGTPKSFIRIKHIDTWSDWQQLATTTDINVKVESFDSSTGTLYLASV